MRVTNHHNIPSVFENFRKADPYDAEGADFTPSSLSEPAMIRHLSEVNRDKLSEDVADQIMSILGTAIHAILEKGCEPDDIVEQRYFFGIEGEDEETYSISGCVDRLFMNGMISDDDTALWNMQDYKSTSASSITHNPEGKPEWVAQLSVYNWLCHHNGIEVTQHEVVCIIRDFVKSQARYKKEYPKAAVVVIPIEVWSLEDTEAWMRLRIAALTAKIPAPCTQKERWQGDTKYAVKKYVRGGGLAARATKIFDSSYDAEAFILDEAILGEVESRPGKPNRCQDWCPVSGWCKQFQDELEEENG